MVFAACAYPYRLRPTHILPYGKKSVPLYANYRRMQYEGSSRIGEKVDNNPSYLAVSALVIIYYMTMVDTTRQYKYMLQKEEHEPVRI